MSTNRTSSYKNEVAKFVAVVDDIVCSTRGRPAGPRRHDERGEERIPLQASGQARGQARSPQRKEPRSGSLDRGAGRPQGLGHRGHEYGRSRHRHHARRQCGIPAVAEMERRGLDPAENEDQYEAEWQDVLKEAEKKVKARCGGGRRTRRSLRARHRTPRIQPHRQPAARTLRTSGRSGRIPLLPVADRRPHAPVRFRRRRTHHGHGQCAR